MWPIAFCETMTLKWMNAGLGDFFFFLSKIMTIFLFQNDDPIDTIVLSKLRVSYLEPLLLLSQKQENNFEITLILE